METTNIAEWQAQLGHTVFFVLAKSESEAKKTLKTKGHGADFTLTSMDVESSVPVPGATSTAPASITAGTASTKVGGTNSTNLPVILKTIGVLGKTPDQKGAIDIPKNHIVVDPAGLQFINGNKKPADAGLLSKAIYEHYTHTDANKNETKISDLNAFPATVQSGITEEGGAFFYEYNEGAVIHVVGPDFSAYPDITLPDAVEKLREAYYNVISEAEKHVHAINKQNENNAYKNGAVVLLPLISMGAFAGKFKDIDQKAELTAHAVIEAFHKYDGEVEGPKKPAAPSVPTQYWMCLYQLSETKLHYKIYEAAFQTRIGFGS